MAPRKKKRWDLSRHIGGPALLIVIGVAVVALLLYLAPEARPRLGASVDSSPDVDLGCACECNINPDVPGSMILSQSPGEFVYNDDGTINWEETVEGYDFEFEVPDIQSESECLEHWGPCSGWEYDFATDTWKEHFGILNLCINPDPTPSAEPSDSPTPTDGGGGDGDPTDTPEPTDDADPTDDPEPVETDPPKKKKNACPAAYLLQPDGTSVYQQNLLKGHIAAGAEATTYERLRTQSLSNLTHITIQETASDVTYLNSLTLLALHHAAGTSAYIDQHGDAYQLTEESTLVVTKQEEENYDTYTVQTHGAPGLLITASLNTDFLNTVRDTLTNDARLQCLPHLYDLVDQLPVQATRNTVTKIGGLTVTNQAGDNLTDFPVILEKAETTLLTLPQGTTSVTLTAPHGAYTIQSIQTAATLTPVTQVDRYQPTNNDSAATVDDSRLRITHATPATLTFAPNPATNVTYYFASHGYYHYAEEAACSTPSLSYDVLWGYVQ